MKKNVAEKALKHAFLSSKKSGGIDAEILKDTLENDADCPGLYVIGTQADIQKISKVVTRLSKTTFGKQLVRQAHENKTKFYITGDCSANAMSYSKKNLVLINPKVDDDKLVTTIAHEIRHTVQYKNMIRRAPKENNIKTAAMIGFSIEADANAIACAVAWQAKENGDDKVWNRYVESYGDVAKPFERSMKKNSANLYNGHALTAAFKGWYNKKSNIDYYQNLYLAEEYKYISAKGGAAKYYYNPEGKKSSAEIIKNLCSIGEKQYFKGLPDILENPKFLGVSQEVKDALEKASLKIAKNTGLVDESYKELPIRETEQEKMMRRSREVIEKKNLMVKKKLEKVR
jgi:hypothetical protein